MYRFNMQYKRQQDRKKPMKFANWQNQFFVYFRKVVDEMFKINLVSEAETLPVSIREYPRYCNLFLAPVFIYRRSRYDAY